MSVMELTQFDKNYNKEQFADNIKGFSKKFIGKGQEGECFLGQDNYVYKIINYNVRENLNTDTIITSDKVESTHFVFPNLVYTINGEIVGIQTNYIPLKDKESSFEQLEPKFIKAVLNFASELESLTKQGFIAIDFSDNFIFDGETLYNIDTTNHVFDNGSKPIAYLMVWNFNGLLSGLRETLGESITPGIDDLFEFIHEKYIDTNLMNMADGRGSR